ncbi:MAG: phosphopyruvate hydratase [Candidatus Zambryskibacteria bacterium]|nr:phosphopyruvate hydratase [Candidatus Zambryskibacteria bacterium]
MSKITKIEAREILDSRGNPTLEVDTTVEEKFTGRFSVPSGASTGEHEALEKRDKDPEHFLGKGVEKLAERIEKEIAPELLSKYFNQKSLDQFLIDKDGTKNKSNFGANTILSLSMSFAKADAYANGMPLWQYFSKLSGTKPSLPTPMINIINGGVHADSGLDIQEFMIVPLDGGKFSKLLQKSDEVFMYLKIILEENDLGTAVGDEGGFVPRVGSHNKALDLIIKAIEKAKFKPGEDFGIALDCAASEFYERGEYVLKSENKNFSSNELTAYYENLIKNYPIVSLEDPFAEDDWETWTSFNQKFGGKLMVVGDDLLVTNLERLDKAVAEKAVNAILIKPNQSGTLIETLGVINQAKKSELKTIISHRSGETEDTSISHLAVGTASQYIKAGSVSRSERIAKYNELLRIEEELGG